MIKINGVEIITENIDDVEFIIINIERYTDEIEKLIMKDLVKISDGINSYSNAEAIKERMKKFFSSQSDNIKKGAVAEFFTHLYLNNKGYKQECKFFNLEEKSIKKGFDGYYSYEGEQWIMESKAGLGEAGDESHVTKIKLAYSDLTDKLNVNPKKNNPWTNAKNHASLLEINPNDKVVKKLATLSNEYESGSYKKTIKNFNIIPVSTIYHNTENFQKIIDEINKDKIIGSIPNYKKLKVICITNETYKKFIKLFD